MKKKNRKEKKRKNESSRRRWRRKGVGVVVAVGGERGELSASLCGTIRPGIKVRLSGLGISLPIGNNEIGCGRK